MSEHKGITAEEALEHAEWVGRLARALAGPDADDLAQATWEAALRDRQRSGSLGAWLTGTMRNLARMGRRGASRRAEHELAAVSEPGASPASPEALVERVELYRAIARLVLELAPEIREVVVLHHYDGLSSQEIAARLGIPAGTVRWRLKQGMDELRRRLDRHDRRWMAVVAGVAAGGVSMQSKKLVAGAAVVLVLGAAMVGLARCGSGPQVAGPGPSAPLPPAGTPPGSAGRPSSPARPQLPEVLQPKGVAWRHVAGIVLAQGQPVAGAEVFLTSDATRTGTMPPPLTTTGADGTFDLGQVPGLTYQLTAQAKGQGVAQLVIAAQDVSTPLEHLVLELPGCAQGLYGTVRDGSGGMVAGAEIRIGGVSEGPPAALSNARGDYQVCLASQRSFAPEPTLGVHADGYGDLALAVSVFGQRRLDVTLVPASHVSGRVLLSGGAPAAAAFVFLEPADPLAVHGARQAALADANGRYQLDDLAPGRYRIGALLPGYSPANARLSVGAAENAAPPPLVLERAAGLEGVVRVGKEPLGGVAVRVLAIGGVMASETVWTTPDGHFALRSAPIGAVRFVVKDHDVLSPERATTPGATPVEVSVRPRARVRGKVLRAGKPVAGAEVIARGGPERPQPTTWSQADGSFELAGLAAGEHQLFAASERVGAFSREPADLVPVTLTAGQTVDGVTISLGGGASIRGVVVDTDGKPLENLYVQYVDDARDDLCRAWTDASGAFLCPMLAGGASYSPRVMASEGALNPLPPAGWRPFPAVTVADGEASIVGQRLVVEARRKSIRGLVLTPEGQPAGDAVVRITDSGAVVNPVATPWNSFELAVADTDGRFEITAWEGGRYDLYARLEDGGEAVEKGVQAGQSGVVLRVAAVGKISGTLEGFDLPVAVLARKDGEGVLKQMVTRPSFTFEQLGAGNYQVWVNSASGGAATRVRVVAGGEASAQLKNGGQATLALQVVDALSHAPLADMVCEAGPDLGSQIMPRASMRSEPSGADGRVELSSTAGEVQVHCLGATTRSDGVARLTVAKGGRAQVVVPVVVPQHRRQPNSAGLAFMPGWLQVVSAVRPGSAAASAGLAPGDVITSVDGRPVADLTSVGLLLLIGDHELGDSVRLTVVHAGQSREVSLPIERPNW